MRVAISSIVVILAVALVGCADSATNSSAPSGALTASEDTAAEWLGRAYSGGAASDVFFEGFWMSDAAFFEDTEAWGCIFRGVVRALREPETQGALDDLIALSTVEPAFPTSHRGEIEAILASLPAPERTRLGYEVISTAEDCGDVRLGLFGGGGPVPVCIYDRANDDQKAQIVASTMGAIYPDHYQWTAAIEEIATGCYDEVAGAYEAGMTLGWVEDLDRRFWDQASTSTTADTNSSTITSTPRMSESRSSPAPEWIGVEYRDEMDLDAEELIHLDVRTTPPTRLEVYGGSAIGGFYSEPFTIVEFYTTPDMNPEEPGERLVAMVEYTEDGTFLVLDAIIVTQNLNERLLQCESPDAPSVLALSFGVPSDSGVNYQVLEAWQLSANGGFETASVEHVRCTNQ